ncbi:MAG: urease accessory protein UreD, partial [Corynebacterium sp.]|nr:urease accessory protein UreD [Corynebacterium sp.]
LPGQTILFGGSRLLQVTDAEVAPGGTLLAAEVMLTGRLARGERDGFDALAQGFRVTRDARPLLSDTLCTTGATARSEMLLSRWPVWGTVLVVPAEGEDVAGLLTQIRDDLPAAGEELTAAASTMVGDAGITVRVAGEDPVSVRALVERVHSRTRERLLGRPAVDLRRM